MYKRRTGREELTIPNVPIEISVPARPVILIFGVAGFLPGGEYQFPGNTAAQRAEALRIEEMLRGRDWRALRGELIDLETSNREMTADWLERVGFAPNTQSHKWLPGHVTDQLVAMLDKHRQVITWLMGLDVETFRAAVRAAHDFFEERRDISGALLDQRLENTEIIQLESGHIGTTVRDSAPKRFRDPAIVFRAIKAPVGLDPWILSQYLMGTGTAPSLTAWFMWDRNGTPRVTAFAPTPLEALGLSVHIDRNFSARQWTTCAQCGKGYEKARGDGRWCSSRCKNYALTTRRRAKVRAVKDAEREWGTLGSAEKKKHSRWRWIADRASSLAGGEEIDADWAKREMSKQGGN